MDMACHKPEVLDSTKPYAPLTQLLSEIQKLHDLKDFTYSIVKITDGDTVEYYIKVSRIPKDPS
jgi:hypothetical protein